MTRRQSSALVMAAAWTSIAVALSACGGYDGPSGPNRDSAYQPDAVTAPLVPPPPGDLSAIEAILADRG